MRLRSAKHHALCMTLSALMAVPPVLFAADQSGTEFTTFTPTTQPGDAKPPLKQEELDQLLAPIALYPDDLLSQILMASTYPLEVVQADRWADENKELKGDALADALNKQTWDPSVKSLVNFPQVLDMMNQKLDWMIKLGDAFIGQQKQVMDTVQSLRAKAKDAGNLESNEQQKIIVEPATVTSPQVIVIEPAQPQVIYVPTYNPTVIYGAWPYPAYPPYYYYPPGYVAAGMMISFGVGFAMGRAWGYAWGGCNWHSSNVNININRNVNINNRIDRNYYNNKYKGNGGNFRHDPSHRQGVPYRDNATAKDFGRDQNRGRDSNRGGLGDNRGGLGNNRGGIGDNRGGIGNNRGGVGDNRGNGGNRPSQQPSRGGQNGMRSGAFDDAGRGQNTRDNSQRGQSSRGGGGGAGGGGRTGGGGGRAGGSGGGGRGGGRR